MQKSKESLSKMGRSNHQIYNNNITESDEKLHMPCTTYPSGMAPFELLPPEIAEIIIKMAMRDFESKDCCPRIKGKHEFLLNVIMRVSKRFQTFATLDSFKSFWRGQLCLHGGTEEIKEAMRYLNDGTTSLNLHGNGSNDTWISGNEILGLAARCPNLTTLSICSATMELLPTRNTIPWTSLICVRLWKVAIANEWPIGEGSRLIDNGLFFL